MIVGSPEKEVCFIGTVLSDGSPCSINPPKENDTDYVNFQLASPSKFACTEAVRTRPDDDKGLG